MMKLTLVITSTHTAFSCFNTHSNFHPLTSENELLLSHAINIISLIYPPTLFSPFLKTSSNSLSLSLSLWIPSLLPLLARVNRSNSNDGKTSPRCSAELTLWFIQASQTPESASGWRWLRTGMLLLLTA